ncbi:MAG: site-specific integrase [Ruminococcus sp.]|nr:site-specific integrase [Ruminococcus sp.]
MATARKLPSGNYRCRVWDKYSQKYKSFTAPTKKAAERAAQEYLDSAALAAEYANDMLFKDAAEQYIEQRRATLSPTTIHLYEGYVQHSTERFNALRLSQITTQLVQDWVNELTVKRSPKTVHNTYGFFTAVMNYHDADIKLSKIQLPKKTRKFKRLPTADIVLQTFKGSDIELPVLLAVWGGLRLSEILGIRKCDIEDNVLTINRVLVYVGREKVYKDRAKTYTSNRQLRLAPPMLALIRKSPALPNEPLITYNRDQIYGRFVKAMDAAGYHISFHDLRHINASTMAELKIPDLYAMERGGWANTATLKAVYQQTFDDARIRVDDIIDDHFEKMYATNYDLPNEQNA